MSPAIPAACSSEYPRLSLVMSPPSTTIFSSRKSRKPAPCRSRNGENAGEFSIMSSKRTRLSLSPGARTIR